MCNNSILIEREIRPRFLALTDHLFFLHNKSLRTGLNLAFFYLKKKEFLLITFGPSMDLNLVSCQKKIK